MTGGVACTPFQVTLGEVVFKNHPRVENPWVGSTRGLSKNTRTFFFFAFHECSQNEEKGRMTSAGDSYVHSGSDV